MNLYYDIDRGVMVRGLNDPSPLGDVTVTLRDLVDMTVLCVTPSDGGANYYQATDMDAGRVLVFGAKPIASLSGNHLVSETNWVKAGTGKYTGRVSLCGSTLIQAVESATSTYTLRAEFVQVDIDGNNFLSAQFNMIVANDVNKGGEATVDLAVLSGHAVWISPSGQRWIESIDDDGQKSMRRVE